MRSFTGTLAVAAFLCSLLFGWPVLAGEDWGPDPSKWTEEQREELRRIEEWLRTNEGLEEAMRLIEQWVRDNEVLDGHDDDVIEDGPKPDDQAMPPSRQKGSVWDKRDPDVIRAEGLVHGTINYTLKTFKEFRESFALRWPNLAGEEQKKNLGVFAVLLDYWEKVDALEEYLATLKENPELGVSITPEHSKIQEMYQKIREANEPLFRLLPLWRAMASK